MFGFISNIQVFECLVLSRIFKYSSVWFYLEYSSVWFYLEYSSIRVFGFTLEYSSVWFYLEYSSVWFYLEYSSVWFYLEYSSIRVFGLHPWSLNVRDKFHCWYRYVRILFLIFEYLDFIPDIKVYVFHLKYRYAWMSAMIWKTKYTDIRNVIQTSKYQEWNQTLRSISTIKSKYLDINNEIQILQNSRVRPNPRIFEMKARH